MHPLLKSEEFCKKTIEPIVAEWALERLKDEREHRGQVTDELVRRLFNDLAISRLFSEGDPGLLALLIADLPAERFTHVADILVKRWPQWNGALGGWSAPVLAAVAPEKAVKLFDEFWSHEENVQHDALKVAGIFEAVSELRAEQAKELPKKMAATVRSDAGKSFVQNMVNPVIRFALAHDADLLDEIVRYALAAETGDDGDTAFHVLGAVYGFLVEGSPFFDLAMAHWGELTTQSFARLAPFFEEGAPLDELDRAVTMRRKKVFDQALAVLHTHCAGRVPTPLLRLLTTIEEGLNQAPNREPAAAFVVGAAAESWTRSSLDFSSLSLNECLDLLGSDLTVLPRYDLLARQIKDFPRDEVVPAVLERFQTVKETYGEEHVARLMGDLGFDEFIAPLIGRTTQDAGDYACEAATDALVQFGTRAQDALVARWDTLDDLQQSQALYVLSHIGGERAVAFLLEAFPWMRSEDHAAWCRAATATPDLRLVHALEPELPRKQSAIDEAFCTMCVLLGYDHPDLALVRERTRERRARAKSLYTSPLEDMLDSETVSLEMRCSACGDTNRYEVHRILINPNTPKEPPIIGEELACLSCGVKEQLDLTNFGRMVVTSEIANLVMAEKSGRDYVGPIVLVRGSLEASASTPIRKVIGRYQKFLKKRPDSIEHLLGLANCYNTMGKLSAAEELFRRCLEVDPACPEAAYGLAHILAADEREEEALIVLSTALPLKNRWRFHRLIDATPRQFYHEYMQFYYELRSNQQETFPAESGPILSGGAAERQKIDRNAPCPCGSGRKYKKCCGRIT